MSTESFAHNFFKDLTLTGAVRLFAIICMALATLYYATHDTAKNKSAYELEVEKTKQIRVVEETKQVLAKNGQRATASSNSLPRAASGCGFPSNANDGSWLVDKGKCFELDNSSGSLSGKELDIGSSSEVTSIDGGDFVVMTSDRAVCKSSGSDRCEVFLKEHSTLSGQGSQGKKYWYQFILTNGQKIKVNTAS